MIETLKSKVRSTVKALPLYRTIKERKKKKIKMRKEMEIQGLIDSGLPVEMKSSLYFLVGGKVDEETETIAQEIENRRTEIASEGSNEVDIWFPKHRSTGNNKDAEIRPTPRKTNNRTMDKIATT